MAAAAAVIHRVLVFVLLARVGDKLGGVERVRGGDLRFEVGGVSLWGGRGRVSRVVRGRGLIVPGQRGPIQTRWFIRRQQLSLSLLVLPAPLCFQASVVLFLLPPLGKGQPVSELYSDWLSCQKRTLWIITNYCIHHSHTRARTQVASSSGFAGCFSLSQHNLSIDSKITSGCKQLLQL